MDQTCKDDIIKAIKDGDHVELHKILERCEGFVNVNYFDDDGETPLHLSCINGNLELVKLLLKFGANARLNNKDGWSPLHIALYWKRFDIAKYLGDL